MRMHIGTHTSTRAHTRARARTRPFGVDDVLLAAVVSKVIYNEGTSASNSNKGAISVTKGVAYQIKFEILR